MMVSTPRPFTSSPLSRRYSTLPGRRALKNSRLVSQKDDVHVCILCLRAIMNYQVRGTPAPVLGLSASAAQPGALGGHQF